MNIPKIILQFLAEIVGTFIFISLIFIITSKEKNGQMDADIKWNFTKFLINKEGKLVAVFPSSVNPLSEEITKHLN